MGGIRRNKHRKPGNNKTERGQKKYDKYDGKGAYKDIVRENKLFEDFYRQQNLCETEEEFQDMLAALRRDLPASFRVTGFRSQAMAIRNLIESKYFKDLAAAANDIPKAQDSEENPIVKIEPKCLSWYPDRMAWQLNLTRRDIRRVEAYFKLHNFLVSETESGNISRQETVSMIPPLVLDVKPHHKVLDMCAAPGSKTAQLIEALHAEEDVIPTGLVVANDSDNSRCYMLVHQAKRLQSPNVLITNHDASIMPNIQVTSEEGKVSNLKFDRVLCDVPCSGDGTLRKNADIWTKWNGANSCNLHGIQFRIAKRGLEMLEVGGRMVYSTCSLNPLEDEAVINRLLNESGGSVELVDNSHLVPGLVYKPGLKKWKVAGKENIFYDNFQNVPEANRSLMRPSMFPEEEDKFHLDRCIRVLPHQQDTGGFFVAVLQKNAPCAWENKTQYLDKGEKESSNGNAEENGKKRKLESESTKEIKKGRYQGFKEDPYIYFEQDEESLKPFKEIEEYFDLKELDSKMFFTRCPDKTKRNNLYFSSLLIRNILETNLDRIKIINTGVKAFAKCENKGSTCAFRLAQEGSLMTIPFLRSKVICPTLNDLEILLKVNDSESPPQLTEMDPKTQEQLDKLNTGSIALVYEGQNKDGIQLKLELVGWKGKSSVRAYVPKNERVHYLRLIGADTSKFEKNKFEIRRELEKKEIIAENKEIIAENKEIIAENKDQVQQIDDSKK